MYLKNPKCENKLLTNTESGDDLMFIKNWLLLLFCFLLIPNLTLASNIIRIGEDAQVAIDMEVEDVVIINGSVEIAGRVLGNVVVIGGNINLKNTAYVNKDVICLGGQISTMTGTIVNGSKVEIGGVIAWKSLPFFSIMKILLIGFLYKIGTAVILLLLSIVL